MTVDTAIRSATWLPPIFRNGYGQSFWTAAAAATEILLVAGSSFGAYCVYNILIYGAIPSWIRYGLVSSSIGILYGGLCIADNQYDFLGNEWSRHSRSRGLVAIASAFVLLLAIGFISDNLKGYSRGTFLTQFMVATVAQVIVRAAICRLIQEAHRCGRWCGPRIVMLTMPGIGRELNLRDWLATQHEEILRCYELDEASGESPDVNQLDRRIAEIRRECRMLHVDAIVIAFDADNMGLVTRAAAALSELPWRIQLLPVALADLMECSRIGSCGRARVLELFAGPCSLRDRFLKRSVDIGAAIGLGVLLSPLLAIVAILIKIESSGPVLFRQTRHGFNNNPIEVLKFRTMTKCADSPDEFRQAQRDDPRVTRIGRILRRTNIDELPQLFNVLKGEMSMVGPRPHAIPHNEMYVEQVRGLWRRHNVKPGITGWAQVNGLRGETDTVDKMRKRVEYDLYYVANWSFLFDLRIMIMTIMSKRAYENAY